MYSVLVAYFLWFIGGFGALGLHRFYLGKMGTGLLYLLTGGLAGIGGMYDFFTLPMQVRSANIETRYRHALTRGSLNDVTRGGVTRRPSNRPGGRETLERVILKTAKANRGIATPSEIALEANTSLDEAKKQLEQLVSKGFAEVRVSRSGKLVYVFPDFMTDETEAGLEDF